MIHAFINKKFVQAAKALLHARHKTEDVPALMGCMFQPGADDRQETGELAQ